MIRHMQRLFALSRTGVWGMLRASLWAALANLSFMIAPGLVALAFIALLNFLYGASPVPAFAWAQYALYSAVAVAVICLIQFGLYQSTFITTYKESASRRISLAEKLRQLPLSFFSQRNLSDLTTTIMNDCAELEQLYSHCVPQLLGSALSTLIIVVGLLSFDWRMGLAVLWPLPAAVWILLAGRSKLGKKNRQFKEATLSRNEAFQEGIETFATIKSCGFEDRYLSGLKEKLDVAETLQMSAEWLGGTMVKTAEAVLRLGLVSTLLTGVWLLSEGTLGLWEFVVFLTVASRIYDPLASEMVFIAHLLFVSEPIARTKQIDDEPAMTGRESFRPDRFDLSFDDVSFSYGSAPVLRHVTFTAKQGQVTALVGPSGGGKSMTARLAARFWDVSSGRVCLGGTDVREISPETLLAHFAIVFQDVVLFDDTVLENIRLGRRDASDEEVLAAAKAAQCDEFVAKMPNGYQTVLGENGSRLSGGQRQRISIARALLKDAPIIILDEATASLDPESETAVQEAIGRLIRNKTALVIAHRLRTVAGADKIVVLSDGQIAEQGTPDELLKAGGTFAAMAGRQTSQSGWSIGRK